MTGIQPTTRSSRVASPLRCVLAVLAICALCAVPATTAGCEDSDVLKEIVYDQASENVDRDNPTKVQVPSRDGKLTSDTAPITRTDDSDTNQDHVKATVVYSPKDAETDIPAPKYLYSKDADTDVEASEAVKTRTEDSDTKPQASKSKKKSKKKNKASGPKQGGSGDSDTKGKKSDGSSKKVNEKGGNSGKAPTHGEADAKVYDATGDEPEIPEANRVAAYGQLAVIVQMLGGEGPLVAVDADLKKGAFSEVFADEGAGKLQTGWSEDGLQDDIDLEAVEQARPDVLVVEADGALGQKQVNKLGKKGIKVVQLPSLTSASKVKQAVKRIGKMLAKSDAVGPGVDTVERASAYCSYHDDLVDEVVKDVGGYAAYDEKVYDDGVGDAPHLSGAPLWSLLVDQWDYDARYDGKFNGVADVVKAYSGAGFATTGYKSSPVSYYMGVGGVVNNAAAISYASKHQGDPALVWQFNMAQMQPKAKHWTYGDESPFAGGVYNLGTSTFQKALLQTADKSEGVVCGLGSARYPAVIVKTRKMRDAFIDDAPDAASGKTDGIYTAFPRSTSPAGGTFTGRVYNGQPLYTTIKTGTDVSKCVLVNPAGRFTDWTQGSVESVLESAWVATRPEFGARRSTSIKSDIRKFYSSFYRYDLSSEEVDDILDGERS